VSLLRHRDFVRLWVGDSISQAGTQIALVAMPLLAIRELDATPFEVGLLTTFETAAFLLVGLPSGAMVDRVRRRPVLVAADVGRALLVCSLPLAWYLDVLTLAQLYAVALLSGVLTVFFDVAYQSYLPHLVGRDHLVEGNGKLEASRAVAQIGGPTAGGLLVQWLTAPYALLVDGLSYLWSALWIGVISAREPAPERPEQRHLVTEIREGLAFVLRHRLLRAITTTTGTANFFNTVSNTALIVVLADRAELDLSAGTIGLFFSLGSIGGLLGAFLAGRVAQRLGQGPAIWLPMAVSIPFMLVIPLVQRGWLLWAVAACWAVFSFAVVVYNITQVSFRQALCPPRLLGRMNATIRFLVWGTMPLGGLVGGALSSTIGLRPTLWVGAVGMALAVLPVFLSPLRSMRELPVAPEDPQVSGTVGGSEAVVGSPVPGAAGAGGIAARDGDEAP
jgi:MFS family permease